MKEYFEVEKTRTRVTVLDTSTLSTTDAVRGVLDDTGVDSFWYMHGDIALSVAARQELLDTHGAHSDTSTGLIAVTREDKAPTHPHAAVVGEKLVGVGPASERYDWCCVGIGRFEETMLLPEATSGAFEYSLTPDAYERIVAVDIGPDWTHLETLDLYRGVK